MNTDKKGCSTCPVGEEQYESFISHGTQYVQYDYRHTNGKLFTTIGMSLEICRKRKNTFVRLEEMAEDEAEHAFNKQHPELNP